MKHLLRPLLFASLFAVSASLTASATSTNLITNGGFETGDFTGYTLSNLNATNVYTSSFGDGLAPHSGSYFAALGNVGSNGLISQTIADTAGQSYSFDFYLASDGDLPNDFSASVDGDTLLSLNSIAQGGYSLYSLAFTGTGSDTISFSERNDPGYLALDDVSVMAVPTSVTPEPSSLVLMATGLVSVAGAVRRRTRLA